METSEDPPQHTDLPDRKWGTWKREPDRKREPGSGNKKPLYQTVKGLNNKVVAADKREGGWEPASSTETNRSGRVLLQSLFAHCALEVWVRMCGATSREQG